jgi:hypothetical protein
MDESEIRLKIIEALVAVAARAEIQDPEHLVKKATILEKYVVNHVIPRAKRGHKQD